MLSPGVWPEGCAATYGLIGWEEGEEHCTHTHTQSGPGATLYTHTHTHKSVRARGQGTLCCGEDRSLGYSVQLVPCGL
jgi:hypothetical protein